MGEISCPLDTFPKRFEQVQILIDIVIRYKVVLINRFLTPKFGKNRDHVDQRRRDKWVWETIIILLGARENICGIFVEIEVGEAGR